MGKQRKVLHSPPQLPIRVPHWCPWALLGQHRRHPMVRMMPVIGAVPRFPILNDVLALLSRQRVLSNARPAIHVELEGVPITDQD